MINDTLFDHINMIVHNYPWEWEGVGNHPVGDDTYAMTFIAYHNNQRKTQIS